MKNSPKKVSHKKQRENLFYFAIASRLYQKETFI